MINLLMKKISVRVLYNQISTLIEVVNQQIHQLVCSIEKALNHKAYVLTYFLEMEEALDSTNFESLLLLQGISEFHQLS